MPKRAQEMLKSEAGHINYCNFEFCEVYCLIEIIRNGAYRIYSIVSRGL